MNQDKKMEEELKEGFDLIDYFLAFWKFKTMILAITLIVTILTGVFSFTKISPVYTTELNIRINLPTNTTTKFGDYNLPPYNSQQYINLITSKVVITNTLRDMNYTVNAENIENMGNNIVLVQPSNTTLMQEQNDYTIKVSAKTSEEALKMANILFENYIVYVKAVYLEGYYNFFYNFFNNDIITKNVNIETNKKSINNNEKILSKLNKWIEPKEFINDKEYNNSNYIIIKNVINPSYSKVEDDIITAKQEINKDEEKIKVDKQNIKDIIDYKTIIDNFFKTSDNVQIKSLEDCVINTSIFLISEPISPYADSDAGLIMNIIIGAFCGGCFSYILALFKYYRTKNRLIK